jgi:hypothetical protein
MKGNDNHGSDKLTLISLLLLLMTTTMTMTMMMIETMMILMMTILMMMMVDKQTLQVESEQAVASPVEAKTASTILMLTTCTAMQNPDKEKRHEDETREDNQLESKEGLIKKFSSK